MDSRITFGDWQLRHIDSRNWQLYHREETKTTKQTIESGTAGQVRWRALEAYYHDSGLHYAIKYAAHEDIGSTGRDMTPREFIEEYERIGKEMARIVAEGLK